MIEDLRRRRVDMPHVEEACKPANSKPARVYGCRRWCAVWASMLFAVARGGSWPGWEIWRWDWNKLVANQTARPPTSTILEPLLGCTPSSGVAMSPAPDLPRRSLTADYWCRGPHASPGTVEIATAFLFLPEPPYAALEGCQKLLGSR